MREASRENRECSRTVMTADDDSGRERDEAVMTFLRRREAQLVTLPASFLLLLLLVVQAVAPQIDKPAAGPCACSGTASYSVYEAVGWKTLQLRGGGRTMRGSQRPDRHDKALQAVQRTAKSSKIAKAPFRPGASEHAPFSGPFLYAIAGRSSKFELGLVQKFDITTGTWTPAPRLDAPRAAFGCARADGRIYVMGGTADFEPLTSVRSLAPYARLGTQRARPGGASTGKPEDGEWHVECPMPFARRFFSAVSWRRHRPDLSPAAARARGARDEAVFVLGGAGRFNFADQVKNDESYVSVQSYDAQNRVWVNHTDMPCGRRHHAAAVDRGRIYVFGGWRAKLGNPELDAQGAQGRHMPADRTTTAGPDTSARGQGEEVTQGVCQSVLADVSSYDPLTRLWRPVCATCGRKAFAHHVTKSANLRQELHARA